MNDKNIQDLKVLIDYFIELNNEFDNKQENQYFTGEAGNQNQLKDRLFEYAQSLFGYDKFPQIVPDEEYERIDEKIYYHGYKDYDHGANLLSHFNFHRGIGVDGTGFYVTTDKRKAYRYTLFDNQGDKTAEMDKVLELKYAGSRRCMSWHLKILSSMIVQGEKITDDIATDEDVSNIEILQNLLSERVDDESLQKKFLKILDMNETILALILGYDYVEVYDRNFDLSHVILLDRGKMVVKESQSRKFFEKSDHYKNGRFDFNGKFEEKC